MGDDDERPVLRERREVSITIRVVPTVCRHKPLARVHA